MQMISCEMHGAVTAWKSKTGELLCTECIMVVLAKREKDAIIEVSEKVADSIMEDEML